MNHGKSIPETTPQDLDASSEWSALGREIRIADPDVHRQALEAVRVIARGIRKRRAEPFGFALPIFGVPKRKASA